MTDPRLVSQLPKTLRSTDFKGLGTRYEGKVRDVYRLPAGDALVLVASDRLSAFDRVLTTVPFKGEVLNRLAQFWFEKTRHVVPNHVLDVPDPNVTVARACEPFKIEVVVRGYLTGSLWRDYESGQVPYGLRLAPGLKAHSAFETAILTPSTKADKGEHDAPLSEAEVVSRNLATARDWARIREAALGLFAAGQAWAKERGLILVDTKYEFGKVGDTLYAIDEIHTPDSSRYWEASTYAERFARGEAPQMLDKENVRQWLIRERGFQGHGALPDIPDEVRTGTAEVYLRAYERIVGKSLELEVGDVAARVEKNLRQKALLKD